MISTATAGTTTYTFTPSVGACTSTATMDIVITAQVTPTIAPIGPLCQNSTAPVLPATSINMITGTWNPATISTATVGAVPYTFTPNTGSGCTAPTTIFITTSGQITPTFTQLGPFCQNSTPLNSNTQIHYKSEVF